MDDPFGEPRCGKAPEKHKKWTPNKRKIDVRGGLGGSGGGLGGDLGPSWLQVAFRSRFGHFWPALEEPRWSQDGPKRGQEEPSLEASWKSRWPVLASSWASMLHFRAMLGHLGAKMANKMGKMTAKSAKMSQDGPTWSEKAHERLPRAAPTGPGSGLRRPPRRAF